MIYCAAFIAAALKGIRTLFSVSRHAIARVSVLLLMVGAAQGQYLGPRTDYAGGNQPLASPLIKDVSGDGILDVVVGNTYGNSISVYLGLGGGAFGPRTDYRVLSAAPCNVVAADINNDGILDLVAGTHLPNLAYALVVLLGTGGGAFASPTYQALSLASSCLGVGLLASDVTGDGRVDLLYVTEQPPYKLVVLPGIVGGFGMPTFSPVSGLGVALVDINADGIQDFITAGISVALGLGGGRFGTPIVYPATGSFPLTGDLNGDGRIDFLFINSSTTAAFMLGQTTGGFSPPTTYPWSLPAGMSLGNGSSGMALGDVTADGRADLLVTDYFSGNLAVIPTASGGGFGSAILRNGGAASPTAPIRVNTADLNGDGRADVVTSNYNSISVYLNQSTPTATTLPAGSAALGLALSPNPAHTAFTLSNIAGAATTAVLRNTLGQEVRRVALRPAGGKAEVSVVGLPAGVYAVQVLGAGAAAVRRVVVE